MILTVICNICKAVLVIVEKDEITDNDIDLYKQTCSCDIDGNTDIECSLEQ